jgi:hypothetical protein
VLVGPDAKILDVIVRVTGARYQDIFSLFTRYLLPKPTK